MIPEGAEYMPPAASQWVVVRPGNAWLGATWGPHFVHKFRIKLPEAPAPKSLSLEEILDEVEAEPSEDSADVLRYGASFRSEADQRAIESGIIQRLHRDLAKHDGHYRTLEAKGAEPIEHMEALVCRDIPEDLHRIAKRNLNMAMASKHQDRAGEKSGEAWEKELQKAENYLHRAWSGRWIG